jgi:hypothetical protein
MISDVPMHGHVVMCLWRHGAHVEINSEVGADPGHHITCALIASILCRHGQFILWYDDGMMNAALQISIILYLKAEIL